MVPSIIAFILAVASFGFLYGGNLFAWCVLLTIALSVFFRAKILYWISLLITMYGFKDFNTKYEEVKEMKKKAKLWDFIKNIF